MLLTPRLFNAINLAARLHRDQVRYDLERTPVPSHLYGVMHILSQITDDEDMLIAGLMHDSLEDVPGYTYEKLTEDCGERVARFVRGVSEELDPNKEDDQQLPWLYRKEAYLKQLENGPDECMLISCADKLHNATSFRHALESRHDTLFKSMISSIENQIMFYEKIYTLNVNRFGETHVLVQNFRSTLNDVIRLATIHG